MLNHKHICVTAVGLAAPPTTSDEIERWLLELVTKVDMELLLGPYTIECQDLGNEGVTGVVGIKTSHASIHCWDKAAVPFLNMDLYSCKDFSEQTVLDHLARFDPSDLYFDVQDRNPPAPGSTKQPSVILSGHVTRPEPTP